MGDKLKRIHVTIHNDVLAQLDELCIIKYGGHKTRSAVIQSIIEGYLDKEKTRATKSKNKRR